MPRSKADRRRLLVLRSGERRFPAGSVPELEVVERTTHSFTDTEVDRTRLAGPFDRTVFTSRAAVRRFFDDVRLAALDLGEVLAVGPATGAAIRARTSSPVVEARGSATSILELLPGTMTGTRVLLPRGDDASDELPRELARRGADPVPLVLYRKIARGYDASLDADALERPFAAAAATSPSAVRWLFAGAGEDAREAFRSTPWVALGPATLRALERRGARAIAIASPPTFESAARLASALAAHGPPK